MSARPSSPSTSNGASVRVRNGMCSAWAASRSACRAARPPLRRRAGRPSAVLPAADRAPTGGVVVRCGRRRRRARRRRPSPAAPRPPRDAGTAAVLCGKAIASTKCSWKRGSTAVSIFSTRRTTPSISRPRRARQQRDERAGPGRVAGRPDVGEVAVGDQAEDHRVESGRSGCRTRRRAGSRRPASIAELVHQQPDAGVERGLGELDRPDVVLGDARCAARSRTVAVVEDVAERPAVGHDPRRPRRERAVDRRRPR